MRCHFLGQGVIVCGGRPRAPNCSTPGCRRKGSLECDCPVERPDTMPKVGDARLHKTHRRVFYVRAVHRYRIDEAAGRSLRRCASDWFAKTSATCDRPICDGCAVDVEGLDYCRPHAEVLRRTRAEHE
jgi:hypothetical protein